MTDETVEELGICGLKLIQSTRLFKYGTDAVLLADFAKTSKNRNVLDLCTGSGIIPLLMYAKNETCRFEALEISEYVSDMARRTMALNGLSDKINVTCGDVKCAAEIYKGRQFDLVTCNPPYMDKGGGLINPDSDKAIARHELLLTLRDVIAAASKLTRPGGTFCMVHRPRRLTDIICLMREYGLEPKRLSVVADALGKEPDMVLVEGLRCGGKYMKVEIKYVKE